MIAVGISILVILVAVFLLAGKRSLRKPSFSQRSVANSYVEPVQKRGANLYGKPMEEYNEVEFDRFAQSVEMRYRVRERYDN